jgi:hypothetical protein
LPLNHSSKYADLTPRQFEAVGRLVVEWSNVEFLLGSLLSRLLGTPEFLGRVYTDEMMAVRLQSAIEKAVDVHRNRYAYRLITKEVLDEISKLNSEIGLLRSTRNKFSHYCWCRTDDETIFGSALSGHVQPSKQLDRNSMTVSLTELDAMYGQSYDVVSRLSAIVEQLPENQEM